MTPPTQAEIDAAVKRASFTIGMVEAGYSAPAEMVADARAILTLAAERRTPGTVEVCENYLWQSCAWNRTDGGESPCTEPDCPIRKAGVSP